MILKPSRSSSYRFVFNGEHGVNCFYNNEEVNYINCGDFANNEATIEEVKEAIKSHYRVKKLKIINP